MIEWHSLLFFLTQVLKLFNLRETELRAGLLIPQIPKSEPSWNQGAWNSSLVSHMLVPKHFRPLATPPQVHLQEDDSEAG